MQINMDAPARGIRWQKNCRIPHLTIAPQNIIIPSFVLNCKDTNMLLKVGVSPCYFKVSVSQCLGEK
jgi:hypothetical protein